MSNHRIPDNVTHIWGRDDFDQCVEDARRVVAQGQQRDRHQLVHDFIFTQSRARKAAVWDGIAVSMLLAFSVALGVIVFALVTR